MTLSISEKLQQKLGTGTYIISHSYLALCKMKKDVEGENCNEISTMEKYIAISPIK